MKDLTTPAPADTAPVVHQEAPPMLSIADALQAAMSEQEAPQGKEAKPAAPKTPKASPRRDDGTFAPKAEQAPAPAPKEAEEEAAPTEGEEEQRKNPPAKSWQTLFKREKRVRELQAQMDARVKQLEEAQTKAQQALALQQEYDADPYAFVEKRGFDYDKWAQRRLGKGQPNPQEEMQKRLEEMQRSMESKVAEAHARAQQEARATAWLDAVPLVAQAETYEPLRKYCGSDEALTQEAAKVAAHHLQTTGKWLTQREACDMLVTELNAQMERMQAIRPQLAPQATTPPPKSRPSATGHSKPVESAPPSSSSEFSELAKLIRWGE